MWQDWVFSIGSIYLTFSILIMWKDRRSVTPVGTSAPTALILSAFAFSFYTLEAWFNAAAFASTAIAWWLVLAFRRPKSSEQWFAVNTYTGSRDIEIYGPFPSRDAAWDWIDDEGGAGRWSTEKVVRP